MKLKTVSNEIQETIPKYSKARIKEALKEKCWINGEGFHVKVSSMSSLHIENCKRFLLQGGYTEKSVHRIEVPKEMAKVSSKFMALLEEELNSRGRGSSNAK